MAAGRLPSLALVASLVSLASSQSPSDMTQTLLINPPVHGIQSYGQLSWGAYGIPGDTWSTLVAQPDSRQDFTLAGFNVSQRFPGTPLPGWKVTVSSKAGLAVPAGAQGVSQPGMFFSGVTVRLSPPAGLVDPTVPGFQRYDADNSWLLCATVVLPDEPTAMKLTEDDGSCKTILSTDCIKMIENATALAQAQMAGSGCPRPDLSRLPQQCQVPGARIQAFEVPMSYTPYIPVNGALRMTASMYLNGTQLSSFGSVPSMARDDRGSIENATTFAIPMALTFGPRAGAVSAQVMQMQMPMTKMICPSAVDKAKKFGGVEPGSMASALGMVLGIVVASSGFFFATLD